MSKKYKSLIFLTSLTSSTLLFGLSLDEKRKEIFKRQENFEQGTLEKHNTELKRLYSELESLYNDTANDLTASADEILFREKSKEIAQIKSEIEAIENEWKNLQKNEYDSGSDSFGIWELGEVPITKLIMEYGSSESMYVIPPDIAKLRLNLHCLLSIPKESWPKMIDLILTHNNVGVKKLNPFVKQLYSLKEDFTNVDNITADLGHLKHFDETSRIIFVYTPPIENIKASFYFLDKFKNPKTTFVYQVGSKVAIVGLVKDVKNLVSMAENVWDQDGERTSKIITPKKMSPDDAVKLLKSYFGGLTDHSRPLISTKGGNNLSAFTLKNENSVVLIGPKDLVDKGENILRKTEGQINDPTELTLYHYQCSHSKPEEITEILSKVYKSLQSVKMNKKETLEASNTNFAGSAHHGNPYYGPNQTQQAAAQPSSSSSSETTENFIPFQATGSILMVVRKDTLPKIKEILKKLDSPKKMVEIEVLLCERRIGKSNQSGINLLKLGDNTSRTKETGFSYGGEGKTSGIMEFLFSTTGNPAKNLPGLDLSYNFLLSQEDVIVTASPSTTTLNQVPTTLAITDQISINTGASKEFDSIAYSREDIGITITMTPTIHECDVEDPYGNSFITLENDIRFETINSNNNDRPSVHKRHITNTVRIPDGQTVIIGGLRSSNTEESKQKVPFLGEIPGFAKIFGSSKLTSTNSEMFIFLKPKVISDPTTDFLRIREHKLKKRPGDTELLLEKINESRRNEEQMRFVESLNLIFSSGKPHEQTL